MVLLLVAGLLYVCSLSAPAFACSCNPPCTGCCDCYYGSCFDGYCGGCCDCNDCSCEDDDSKCTEAQICNGCECKCDDSDNETTQIDYEPDVSGLLSSLESAIEEIPCVGSAGITFDVSGQLNSKDVCCDESDTSYTECISGSADANVGAELSLDITNTKDFSFNKT